MSSADLIQTVRDALAKASPGPWVQWVNHGMVAAGDIGSNDKYGIEFTGMGYPVCECSPDDNPIWSDDANLIANATTWLAFLVARVEEQDRALAALWRVIDAQAKDNNLDMQSVIDFVTEAQAQPAGSGSGEVGHG